MTPPLSTVLSPRIGGYRIDEHEGLLFLVMDFVYGTDLRHVIHDGPFDPMRAVELLGQTVDYVAPEPITGAHTDARTGPIADRRL